MPRPPLRPGRTVHAAATVLAATLLLVLAVPVLSPIARGSNVTLTLYGRATTGWSFNAGAETNPGPMISVNAGDVVTLHIVSEDGLSHGFFADLDDNSRIGARDIASGAGVDVTSTVTVPNAPGTHYYYCSIHSGDGYGGGFLPGAPMSGEFFVRGAAFVAPIATTSWTGGSPQEVRFNLVDQDPPTSLTLWVNFSHSGGTVGGSIAGPIAGTANPNTVAWTPTPFNAGDIVVNVTVLHPSGSIGYSRSVPFEVDSVPPTILDRLPQADAVNVPQNSNPGATWSEPMAKSASGAANAFALQRVSDGGWVSGTTSWSTDGRQVTFDPSALLDPTTTYRVFVNTSARDDSSPGNPLQTAEAWQFTTGASVDATAPTIQSALASPATQVSGGTVSITADVTDDIGVASASAHVTGPSFDENLTMIAAGGSVWSADRTYENPGTYAFEVWAFDGAGNFAARPGSFVISPVLPQAPGGVTAQALEDGTIQVAWAPVTSGTIAGYHVYRGTAETGPFTRLTTSPIPASGPFVFVDRGVATGATYFYAVTAVDASGNESPPSAAASASPRQRPSTNADPTLWIAVGAGTAVAVSVILAVLRRRRS